MVLQSKALFILQPGIFISLFYWHHEVTDVILLISMSPVLALSRYQVCTGWEDDAGSPLLPQHPHLCIYNDILNSRILIHCWNSQVLFSH